MLYIELLFLLLEITQMFRRENRGTDLKILFTLKLLLRARNYFHLASIQAAHLGSL